MKFVRNSATLWDATGCYPPRASSCLFGTRTPHWSKCTSPLFLQPCLLPTCAVWWLVGLTASLEKAAVPVFAAAGEMKDATCSGKGGEDAANPHGFPCEGLVAMEFEVFGKVQGVFFRAHTKEKAQELGLVGYCMNTRKGTVLGEVQGETNAVQAMFQWLRKTGSPSSRITDCKILNLRAIKECGYSSFSIRR